MLTVSFLTLRACAHIAERNNDFFKRRRAYKAQTRHFCRYIVEYFTREKSSVERCGCDIDDGNELKDFFNATDNCSRWCSIYLVLEVAQVFCEEEREQFLGMRRIILVKFHKEFLSCCTLFQAPDCDLTTCQKFCESAEPAIFIKRSSGRVRSVDKECIISLSFFLVQSSCYFRSGFHKTEQIFLTQNRWCFIRDFY